MIGVNPALYEQLESKLQDVVHELRLRAMEKASTLADCQRMYGVALGLRIALMELNALEGRERWNTYAWEFFDKLLQDGFGVMTRQQMREYAWPEFPRREKRKLEVQS